MIFDRTSASSSSAAIYSLVYPLMGAISAMVVGFVSDRYTQRRRGPIMLVSMGIACLALLLMWIDAASQNDEGQVSPVYLTALMGLVGFGIYGPYSILSALSMDLCRRHDQNDVAHGRAGGFTAVFQGLQDGAGCVL